MRKQTGLRQKQEWSGIGPEEVFVYRSEGVWVNNGQLKRVAFGGSTYYQNISGRAYDE